MYHPYPFGCRLRLQDDLRRALLKARSDVTRDTWISLGTESSNAEAGAFAEPLLAVIPSSTIVGPSCF